MTLEAPSSAQVEVWRQKVKDGTITNDELKEAIQYLREGRMAAAAKPGRTKTARGGSGSGVSATDAEELLKELEDL